MNVTFAVVLAMLGAEAAFRIANAARVAANYLFGQFLPEMPKMDYNVDSGSMTIRPIMTGLVGMDSEYPEGAIIQLSTFMEQTAKTANRVVLPEKALREIQKLRNHLLLTAGEDAAKQALVQEVLNFIAKVIVQPHLDTAEWLRGQALAYGEIDWTFDDIRMVVDYGVPAENKFDTRTTASGEAYGAASSKFWTDWKMMKRLLRNNWRASITHPDTWDEIVTNEANNIQVLSETNGRVSFRRYRNVVAVGGGAPNIVIPSEDNRDTGEIILYDLEAEVLDLANPGQTKKVPFQPRGVITNLANNTRNEYRVGEGATGDPDNDLPLGYTHLGPTTEDPAGRPGRWARTFTPEGRPMQLQGEGVTNILPVIEAPKKIVVMSTELAA